MYFSWILSYLTAVHKLFNSGGISLANIDVIFQHRVDQETIFLKDEQLKVWIARVQEMDALQSTLQVELRERTEQYNQLWMGCQRQVDLQ